MRHRPVSARSSPHRRRTASPHEALSSMPSRAYHRIAIIPAAGTTADANVLVKKLREADGLSFGNSVYKVEFSDANRSKLFSRQQGPFSAPQLLSSASHGRRPAFPVPGSLCERMVVARMVVARRLTVVCARRAGRKHRRPRVSLYPCRRRRGLSRVPREAGDVHRARSRRRVCCTDELSHPLAAACWKGLILTVLCSLRYAVGLELKKLQNFSKFVRDRLKEQAPRDLWVRRAFGLACGARLASFTMRMSSVHYYSAWAVVACSAHPVVAQVERKLGGLNDGSGNIAEPILSQDEWCAAPPLQASRSLFRPEFAARRCFAAVGRGCAECESLVCGCREASYLYAVYHFVKASAQQQLRPLFAATPSRTPRRRPLTPFALTLWRQVGTPEPPAVVAQRRVERVEELRAAGVIPRPGQQIAEEDVRAYPPAL